MGIKLKGIPKDKEFTDNLALLLGYLVIWFGLFEFGLTGIVAVIYHDLGGKRIEREIPVSLSRSLAIIRKSVRRISQLHTHRAELEWICKEAKRLADIRNDLVHGYIAEYDKGADHLLTFAKATPDNN